MSATSVYLILGVPGSGRRAIVADLIEHGVSTHESVAVLLPEEEGPHPEDDKIRDRATGGLATGKNLTEAALAFGGEAKYLFVLFPGLANPVDRLEEWKELLSTHRQSFELHRIITVVHCGFLSRNPGAAPWYEACIHFSDAVLLNHRNEAGNRWVGEFEKQYRKAHYPCLFEPVKKNAVRNPAAILVPEPRRLSQAFDFWEEELVDLEWDIETEIVDTGDTTPTPDDHEEDEPVPEDPYFARMPGGRRRHKIPDIRKFIPAQDPS